jgi:signal transduction histidine kinase
MPEKSWKELEKRTKRLREAYDEQKALDKLKDELVSNVSHELRTPLAICRNAIELVMEEEDKEERNELLTIGKDALTRQNKIIGDLVDTAKIQRGAFELNLESLDLEQVITLSKKEIEPLALRNNIHIKTSLQEDLPRITADNDKLKHVFFDLLDNAIKFNREGGEVIIEARQKDNQVEVSVSDSGIGIAEAHLDKIFNRFYQVDGSTKRKYGGVGLGLAMAKDIIERHDGEIWVESGVGKGSKFTFELPIKSSSPFGKTIVLPEKFRKRFPSLATAINGKKK